MDERQLHSNCSLDDWDLMLPNEQYAQGFCEREDLEDDNYKDQIPNC